MIDKIKGLKKYVNNKPSPNKVSMYDNMQIGNKAYNRAIDDVVNLLTIPDVSNTEGKVCVVCGKVLTRSEANGGNCCDICWLSN